MSATSDPAMFLPLGASAFYILLALAEGERHGYSISKEVEGATSGSVKLGPGTLYRQIKQMLADGWISEVHKADPEDARRRYYQLTLWGHRIARAEAERLASVVRVAQSRKLLPLGALA